MAIRFFIGQRYFVCGIAMTGIQGRSVSVNVLCVGAWIIGIRVVEEVLRAFLDAQFSTEEEFRRRVQKLTALEQEAARR